MYFFFLVNNLVHSLYIKSVVLHILSYILPWLFDFFNTQSFKTLLRLKLLQNVLYFGICVSISSFFFSYSSCTIEIPILFYVSCDVGCILFIWFISIEICHVLTKPRDNKTLKYQSVVGLMPFLYFWALRINLVETDIIETACCLIWN